MQEVIQSSAPINRYHRQSILAAFPADAQQRLADTHVTVLGCGALGCAAAEQLCRAGIGKLTLIDRDVVELTNLQRQVLFDESHARAGTPKVVAAKERLSQINSCVVVHPLPIDIDSGNIESTLQVHRTSRFNLTLDATDNAQTRYLLNDVCVKHGFDFVYGGVVGMEGRALGVRPGQTPCLRCIFPMPPDAGELDTCDTVGVLGASVMQVASTQVTIALQMIFDQFSPQLIRINTWQHTTTSSDAGPRDESCTCCGKGEFEFLNQPPAPSKLCGRNAVQVKTPGGQRLDLVPLSVKLARLGTVQATPLMVKLVLDEHPNLAISLFADGRMIVFGTDSQSVGKSIMARIVGV
jgi:molybdopterin-synthase adenylyltransferase